MFRLLKSPNPLLSVIVRFLNSKDVSANKIRLQIQESTTSELVPVFAFLGNWLATHTAATYASEEPKIRSVFQLLGLISLKVPPVVLFNGVFDLNWGMYQPHWHLHEFYKPINERLIQLRSYARPFSIYAHLFPEYSVLPVKGDSEFEKDASVMIQVTLDPSYSIAGIEQFKKLMINHAPLESFTHMFEQKNSRSMLTRAITELLRDLNEEKNASHGQLMFSFSSLFLYIHAFTASNQIDGQLLCEFLQSRPFLSPFCVLAMVNHIPMNLYLFNLLAPREVAQNPDQQKPAELSQYTMVDLAKEKTMTSFVQRMPKVLWNYLTSGISQENVSQADSRDDAGFFSFVHLAHMPLVSKTKWVLGMVKERVLGPLHVCGMSILLLKFLTLSVQKALVDAHEHNVLTPGFCNLLKSTFALLAPTVSNPLCDKFFDLNQCRPVLVDSAIRGTILHLLPLVLHHPSNEHIISYCLKTMTLDDAQMAQRTARIMITKLLQCDYPKLSEKLLASLLETNDAFILLEYIEALGHTTVMQTCEEYQLVLDARKKLLARVDVKESPDHPNLFVIDSVSLNGTKLNALSTTVLGAIERMSQVTATKDAMRVIRETDRNHLPAVLRVLSMTVFMKNREFASVIVNELVVLLGNHKNDETNLSFELRPCEYALPVAQSCIGRLLAFNLDDLACLLLTSMKPLLLEDSAPLHWISSFLARYRPLVSETILTQLAAVVSRLECADELFLTGDDLVHRIGNLLVSREMLLVQDPNTILREYPSPYAHAQVFCSLALNLRLESNEEIAAALTSPLFAVTRTWRKKDSACACLAKLAATMNRAIAYRFFEMIMNHDRCEMGLLAGRLFLMKCRIDVFKTICTNTLDMIKGSSVKLDYFMRMVMPSFQRLKGDDETATILLCGFLSSVSETTSHELQEAVIDVVGLVYIKLKLYESRKRLINAANKFKPDLKAIIPGSFELDFTKVSSKKPEHIP